MRKVLLHICCGPCATHVIEVLRGEYAVTGFFSNSNLFPAEEYERRLAAAREVCRRMDVPLVGDVYNPDAFRETVRGWENEPENGSRCTLCYRLRLSRAARYAAENGMELLATTLTVGPMKKAVRINPVLREEAQRAGLEPLEEDWKKKDGYRRSCELSREYGIYRQHYCGCRFSLGG